MGWLWTNPLENPGERPSSFLRRQSRTSETFEGGPSTPAPSDSEQLDFLKSSTATYTTHTRYDSINAVFVGKKLGRVLKRTMTRYIRVADNGVMVVSKEVQRDEHYNCVPAGGETYVLNESVEIVGISGDDGDESICFSLKREGVESEIVVKKRDNKDDVDAWAMLLLLSHKAMANAGGSGAPDDDFVSSSSQATADDNDDNGSDNAEKSNSDYRKSILNISKSNSDTMHSATIKPDGLMPFPYAHKLTPPLLTGFESAIANRCCKSKITSDGSTWEEIINEKNVNGEDVIIWRSESKVSSRVMRFKTRTTIHASPDEVHTALNTFPSRNNWDKAMVSGATLKQFSDPSSSESGNLCTFTYTTAPALSGAISSRNFFDVRWCSPIKEDGSRMFVTYTMDNLDKNPIDAAVLGWTPPLKGVIRAHNYEGAQFLDVKSAATATQPMHTQITMISVSEIGGWLPPKVIAGATSGAILGMMTNMTTFCEAKNAGKYPKVGLAAKK